MRNSDRAWLALAGGVAAYDLIATDDERLSDAVRGYFKSRPVATADSRAENESGAHPLG
jgi:hypothetical protein